MGWISFRGVAPVMALLVAALTVAVGVGTAQAEKLERPDFALVSDEGDFQIRDYGALVLAQFTMRGTYNQAVSQGYINLEKYYTGANTPPEAIPFTVPVMARDDLASGWTTIFVLPKAYRVETAPRPIDRRIRVVEVPARRVAAILFTGKLNEGVMRERIAALEAWLAAKGIAHEKDFTLAAYGATWGPSRAQKNEVIVTLK
jgi:DNA gyrase inhibitor GyrI